MEPKVVSDAPLQPYRDSVTWQLKDSESLKGEGSKFIRWLVCHWELEPHRDPVLWRGSGFPRVAKP